MATITAPVEGYDGEVGGVHFINGVAETDAPAVIAYCLNAGYKVEYPEAEVAEDDEAFDPGKHTVDEVLAHLLAIDDTGPEAHDAEVVRVLEAEKAGRARKSLIEAIEVAPAK